MSSLVGAAGVGAGGAVPPGAGAVAAAGAFIGARAGIAVKFVTRVCRAFNAAAAFVSAAWVRTAWSRVRSAPNRPAKTVAVSVLEARLETWLATRLGVGSVKDGKKGFTSGPNQLSILNLKTYCIVLQSRALGGVHGAKQRAQGLRVVIAGPYWVVLLKACVSTFTR